MTQEESLAKAKRELKIAKTGKEVAEAMMGHFKHMVKERERGMKLANLHFRKPFERLKSLIKRIL